MTTNSLSSRTTYLFEAHTRPGTTTSIEYQQPIYVRDHPDWNEFVFLLASMKPDHITLVADDGLPDLLTMHVFSTLHQLNVSILLVRLAVNERSKTMESVESLVTQMRENGGGTHASLIIALGGGLVGNIVGLAASLMVRGVKLVHIPTTLLASTDSVISFKQGVNGAQNTLLIKNLLGTFKAPECVFVYLSLWQTLPADEIRAGLCELIKNVIAIHPHCYDDVFALLNPDAVYTLEEYRRIFLWCLEAKQAVMRDDAHEQGRALVLEFGHTVGHAVEIDTGMKHGLAIGLGLVAAMQISVDRGYIQSEDQAKAIALLKRNGSPTRLTHAVSLHALMERIRCDNKIGYLPQRSGYHVMVLLKQFGQPVLQDDMPLCYVSEKELQRALTSIQKQEPIQTGRMPTYVNL